MGGKHNGERQAESGFLFFSLPIKKVKKTLKNKKVDFILQFWHCYQENR